MVDRPLTAVVRPVSTSLLAPLRWRDDDVTWVVARLSRDGALHANDVALINFLKRRRADLQRRLWPILDLAACGARDRGFRRPGIHVPVTCANLPHNGGDRLAMCRRTVEAGGAR